MSQTDLAQRTFLLKLVIWKYKPRFFLLWFFFSAEVWSCAKDIQEMVAATSSLLFGKQGKKKGEELKYWESWKNSGSKCPKGWSADVQNDSIWGPASPNSVFPEPKPQLTQVICTSLKDWDNHVIIGGLTWILVGFFTLALAEVSQSQLFLWCLTPWSYTAPYYNATIFRGFLWAASTGTAHCDDLWYLLC